jgi:hypothetical protein
MNKGAEAIAGRDILNYRSGIAFKTLEATGAGLPTSEENKRLLGLEEMLFKLFDNQDNSVIVLVITADNSKEYVIYHNMKFNFKQNIQSAKDIYKGYVLTTYTEEDNKWQVYSEYKPNEEEKKYSKCNICGKEMKDKVSCKGGYVIIKGQKIKRKTNNEQDICHDCGAGRGQFHHENCDMERCPKCGGQLIGCDCDIESMEYE